MPVVTALQEMRALSHKLQTLLRNIEREIPSSLSGHQPFGARPMDKNIAPAKAKYATREDRQQTQIHDAHHRPRISLAHSAVFQDANDRDASDELAEQLAKYLVRHKATVGKNYNYSVGDKAKNELEALLGKKLPGGNAYQWNLSLRKVLKGELVRHDPDTEPEIADEKLCLWIVKHWGGTDRNDELTVRLREILNDRIACWKKHESGEQVEMKFDRISSWSKVLALAFPKECAIYDSRTAFALNWLHFKINRKYSSRKRCFKYWPVPSGTNTLIGLMNPEQLLVAHHIDNMLELIEYEEKHVFGHVDGVKKSFLAGKLRRTIQIEPRLAYQAYCTVLRKLAKKLYRRQHHQLLRTEMLLFSAATQSIPSEVFAHLNELGKNGRHSALRSSPADTPKRSNS
jgi:hypothetical protein